MRAVRRTSALVGLCVAFVLLAADAAMPQIFITGPVRVRLGEQDVSALPASPVHIQLSEAAVTPGAPAVTHSHAMGWAYTVEGLHLLTVAGDTRGYISGEAAWLPDGVEHTHDWHSTLKSRVLFMAIVTGQSSAPPSGFRTVGVSEPLQGLGSGPHRIVLERISFGPKPSNFSLLAGAAGPGVVIRLAGEVLLVMKDGRTVRPSDVLTVQEGVLLKNVPDQSGSVLNLIIVPVR